MAGISYLRPQYSNLAASASRLAAGGRQVAHETDLNQISGITQARASGGQDEVPLQETAARPADEKAGQGRKDRQTPAKEPAAAPAGAPGEAMAESDPQAPPVERMAALGLVVVGPMPMFERRRAAEEAYGYSRTVLRDEAEPKLGGGFDAAS